MAFIVRTYHDARSSECQICKIKNNSLKKLVRMYGAYSRMYGAYSRMYGAYSKMYGAYSRMYGAYSRIKEKLDKDQQMLCFTDGFDDVVSNARSRSGTRDWSRSRQPSGLRRGSGAARLLGFQVRISPGAWMSFSGERCVLLRSGLCDGPITRPEESYRLWCV